MKKFLFGLLVCMFIAIPLSHAAGIFKMDDNNATSLSCTDCVDDTMIDWGTGAGQVSGSDLPDEDVGDVTISSGAWAVEDDSHAHTSATITLASTDLTDTADLLYEDELDSFSELQTQIADKTLVNEEDAVTWDNSHVWAKSGLTGHVFSGENSNGYVRVSHDDSLSLPTIGGNALLVIDKMDGGSQLVFLADTGQGTEIVFGDDDDADAGMFGYYNADDAWIVKTATVYGDFLFDIGEDLSFGVKDCTTEDDDGGNLTIQAGDAGSGGTGNHDGGDITIIPGSGQGSGSDGSAIVDNGNLIVDADNAEAFLVRANGDGGDVFNVDTSNGAVEIASGINLVLGANTLNSGDLLDGTKVADADLGDVGVSSGAWAVEDDSHAHTSATITLASTDLTDTADLLYESELDAFSELQSQIADKTLVNEEDAVAFDSTVSVGGDVTLQNGEVITNSSDDQVKIKSNDSYTIFIVEGYEASDAYMFIRSDDGDDDDDAYRIHKAAGSTDLTIFSSASGTFSTGLTIEADGDIKPTQGYLSSDGTAGATDNTSYWLCTAADCSTKCQVDIKDGLITACT